MEYQIGQVVYSKCGHDKGDVLLVAAVNGEYLTLVDGKRRTLEKPKRKKIKHVQPTSYIEETVAQKLMQH
ncbi:MAG: KOW domain-containing RNA-binding protein, partial [Anaerotignum sp.]|nr:KOW domain-containing RNA-binding protein [Anaerotignum sp.]